MYSIPLVLLIDAAYFLHLRTKRILYNPSISFRLQNNIFFRYGKEDWPVWQLHYLKKA